MDKAKNILAHVKMMIEKKYPYTDLFLYGSRSRGDANNESDWDILVLVDRHTLPFSLETEIMNDFYDLEIELGELLSPIIYTKKEWKQKYSHSPLYENIVKEAVRIG